MRLTLRASVVAMLLLAATVLDKGAGVLWPAVLWGIAPLDWWLAGTLLGWALARVLPQKVESTSTMLCRSSKWRLDYNLARLL